jgi:hypothetical protein
MKYEEIIIQSYDVEEKHIVIDNGDGSFKSFPADNFNPEFISFLRQLEKTNDPYYLAWVDEGNNPDEFWSQGEL